MNSTALLLKPLYLLVRLCCVWAGLALAGCAHFGAPWAGPEPLAWRFDGTAAEQFNAYRALMTRPGRASAWADELQAAAQGADAQAATALPALWALLQGLSTRERDRPHPAAGSVAIGVQGDGRGASSPAALLAPLPAVLRAPVQAQLQAMLGAQQTLTHALRHLPPELRRDALLRDDADALQIARLAPQVDLPALGAAMHTVIDATAQLRATLGRLEREGQLPRLLWRHHTPQGWVHVDTTGESRDEAPQDVWLWVKVGGDDRYRLDQFHGAGGHQRAPAVRVLLDTDGDDEYESTVAGGDASAGVLGLSLHWDGGGRDAWRCTRWCQGAALLGAAALVNEGAAADHLRAQTQAQAHAVGGLALLASNTRRVIEGSAATHYEALSDAQASAGPSGVALLVDAHGDDRYSLAARPLVAPSSQLPERNRSMGQGAGRGWRFIDSGQDVLETAGGIGVLIDLQGDDDYSAQVFAQGAGYQQGLGALIDARGSNRHHAAWYALGAAAHGGAGVFVASGAGDDDYRVSHVTALGAGHDFALGWFEDRGGNDRYAIGDVGLGVSSDRGSGVFIDTAGRNCVRIDGPQRRVMGHRFLSQPAIASAARAGSAVFTMPSFDEHCNPPR